MSAALAGLDAESPTQRSRAALALLDAVEPQPKAALDLELPSTPEGVAALGLGELRSLAASLTPALPTTTS